MRKPSSPGKEKKIEGKDKIRLKKDNNYNTIAIRKLHRTILYPISGKRWFPVHPLLFGIEFPISKTGAHLPVKPNRLPAAASPRR